MGRPPPTDIGVSALCEREPRFQLRQRFVRPENGACQVQGAP